MHIQQFYDEGLAHASYAILSKGKIALVDPGRNPKLYYDFVSLHLDLQKNEGATIYVSKLVGATYPGFFVEYLQFLGQIPACFA
jgi:hydroxyacylglutathione hydrolase